MSKKEEQSEAYIKPIILDRNKKYLKEDNWKLGFDYMDFTGYEVQCAFEDGWNAAVKAACEWLEENADTYIGVEGYAILQDKFFEDFRKAVEE